MAPLKCQGRGVHTGSHILLPWSGTGSRAEGKTNSVKTKSNMESVRSTFHAQLATVMDSLLAAAVCEIAKIFESSLCEQQAELAQKSQEISILRGKLERRQRAREDGDMASGEREGGVRQQGLTGSGNMYKILSSVTPERCSRLFRKMWVYLSGLEILVFYCQMHLNALKFYSTQACSILVIEIFSTLDIVDIKRRGKVKVSAW